MKKITLLVFLMLLMAAGCAKPAGLASNPQPQSQITATPEPAPTGHSSMLREPINNSLSRVTKKPFGIYITPATSPVQPEKFKGYHTGVDFEAFDNEQTTDVPVYAACDGKLLLKKSATGYGGIAVQSCKLDGADVTIIYGHLKLVSVSANIGDTLKAGDQITILGKGYSTETSGERKHLHFGIHKGTTVNILGYTQNKSSLNDWLDAREYLK